MTVSGSRSESTRSVIHEGLATQLPDIDPEETNEWLESFDHLVGDRGRDRARYLMLRLLERAREKNVGVPALRSTDFINTIPPEREPWFPGNEEIERKVRRMIRWNAAVMVSGANRKGLEVGGHIASYASAASLYEVGYNHHFRGKNHPGGGDQVFFQGHAAPGIYARSFLVGRLTEQHLRHFRQEGPLRPRAKMLRLVPVARSRPARPPRSWTSGSATRSWWWRVRLRRCMRPSPKSTQRASA